MTLHVADSAVEVEDAGVAADTVAPLKQGEKVNSQDKKTRLLLLLLLLLLHHNLSSQ